ncbi:MAG: rhomboid family intramembrane serine protease [Cytophagales bacterium]|nr:rhomboid family intramembrane serine protease [Cytophagales bacterium]
MRLRYNSPVILTFTIFCAFILLLDNILVGSVMPLFTVYPDFTFQNPISYFRLVSHAMGHADWTHFTNNFIFILLLGPILEEKYGSKDLMIMMLITALIPGVLNVLFMDTALLGASGLVYMFIILSSVVNVKSGEIPMTFILVVVVFLGKEFAFASQEAIGWKEQSNVSYFGHILGGICGSLFGFLGVKTKKQTTSIDNEF